MKKPIYIEYLKYRHVTTAISAVVLLLSIFFLATRGLNFGLDFTGGTLLELQYSKPVDVQVVQQTLDQAGYRDVAVQYFGSQTDVIVRTSEAFRDGLGAEIIQTLQSPDNKLTLQRSEFVGASVGEDLRDQGGLAILVSMFLLMIYIAARFQFKFGVAAVLGLVHDVVVILGLFAFFQWDVDLTVLAAMLAVVGYSLNDTIVVADRIRENFRVMRRGTSVEVINDSINQTMDRTIMTGLTSLVTVIALMVFGGDMIYYFSVAFALGIVVGTYSTIFCVSSVLLWLNVSREDLMPPAVEEVDDRP